ncbi:hypothetical protein [Aeromonas hydrophila]|uniref:hypothetical protein n=1 Tax=Aeromonas hydrophila TaxID=644 RepID=UPI0008085716|nr:hypothetical protein [Aeromonas hydrophila]OCA65207.1 hypothetical protein A9R12_13820 [Aeromonas hydrophila]
MKIELPGIADQQLFVFKAAQQEAIEAMKKNSEAKVMAARLSVDESAYPRTHLLREREGWEPPHKDLVAAYFQQFKELFGYGSDKEIADLLGLLSDRRVREFKQGKSTVPFGVWRRFLVMTGRAPQEVIPVLGVVVNK